MDSVGKRFVWYETKYSLLNTITKTIDALTIGLLYSKEVVWVNIGKSTKQCVYVLFFEGPFSLNFVYQLV